MHTNTCLFWAVRNNMPLWLQFSFPGVFQSTLICKGHIPLLQFETVYRSTSIQQLRAKACGVTAISTTQTSGTQFQ